MTGQGEEAQAVRQHVRGVLMRLEDGWPDELDAIVERIVDSAPFATVAGLSPLRYGQALFNDLYRVAPDIADRIRSSEDDPFYEDERVPAFLAAVVAQARTEAAFGPVNPCEVCRLPDRDPVHVWPPPILIPDVGWLAEAVASVEVDDGRGAYTAKRPRATELVTEEMDLRAVEVYEAGSHERASLPAMHVALAAVASDIAAAARAGLPEWRCPSCGAVTRARMADHPEQGSTPILIPDVGWQQDGADPAARPAVCAAGCQVQAMLADAQARREEPSTMDDPETIRARRDGLLAEVEARVRRECAEEHLRDVEYLLSAYPADVFPADSESPDAIAGTALRIVLAANLKRWRAKWSGPGAGA